VVSVSRASAIQEPLAGPVAAGVRWQDADHDIAIFEFDKLPDDLLLWPAGVVLRPARSDFDPDGEQIAESFASSAQRDFSIANIDAVKVALSGERVKTLTLPPAMKAKKTIVNYAKFTAKFGDDVFELEAIPPARPPRIGLKG
jgi:hypothetical protein